MSEKLIEHQTPTYVTYNDGLPEFTPEEFINKQHDGTEMVPPAAEDLDAPEVQASNPAEAQELNEFIKVRTEQAIADCEFETTPEVIGALEGYYRDHYLLAGAIKAASEGRYDSSIFTTILEDTTFEPWESEIRSEVQWGYNRVVSPNALTAALQIARMAESFKNDQPMLDATGIRFRHNVLLTQCGMDLVSNLFQESSVGASTMGEHEDSALKELSKQLYEASLANDPLSQNRSLLGDGFSAEGRVENAKQNFWNDTRHAGQLEFHGSEDLAGIDAAGLMSRNTQVRTKGFMNAAMLTHMGAGDENDVMHSVVPHFSEQYQEGGYTGRYEGGGTLAIPIAKILRHAPFARDAKYAMIAPKSRDVIVKVPLPTMEYTVGSSGAGKVDQPGERGVDRVFFATNDETSERLPDDYIINMHDTVEKPATYIVDRKISQHSGERELNNLTSGLGSAERLFINPGDDTAEKIRQLQQDYLEAYAQYGIVVPLRRGVFATAFENMPVELTRGRSHPRIYNKYTPGSEKRATS